ncbi:hypothetical protein [Actinoplanes sp. NPDC023714]|uniref:hypothetical protein n=1 Tax=Actinoplanes sp. NPDC023714 TaxID=3154322 RepID=UPI0033FD833B
MTDLLRTLDDEPDTPCRVDISAAIAAARKKRRLRRGVAGTSAAVVTVAASAAGFALARPVAAPTPPVIPATAGPSGPAPAPPAITACELSRLPVPDGEPMALVSGADPTGAWIVGRTYPEAGGYQAVIWHDGEVAKVALPGDLEESLRDVNGRGTAVGWSYAAYGPVPYAYHDGEVTRLAEAGEALAINENGRIAGDDGRGRAVVWESAGAAPVTLPVPAGTTTSQARDVDLDGTVAGSLDLDTPYVWRPDGTHGALPMPEIGGTPAAVAQVFRISNGWAVGMASSSTLKDKEKKEASGARERVYAARWNLRTGTAEITGELTHPADAVNAYGWQTGTDADGYAVVVTGEDTIRLPGLGRHDPGGNATIATTISDDGGIVAGQSDDESGTIQAVVWQCR